MLTMTSPLVTKRILSYLSEAYAWHRLTPAEQVAAAERGILNPPRGIGYGIGLAFGLFAMQEVASLVGSYRIACRLAIGELNFWMGS